MKKSISIILLLLAAFLVAGCGCKQKNTKQYQLKLEVWGLFDDSDAYNLIFENYRKMNPQIAGIDYKKLTPDTYKQELVEALASGQGPDIFLIHNNWLPSFKDKIVPAPAEILNEQKFRKDFVDVAADNFIDESKVYSAPLSVDTLGLYYNRDLFNAAGISSPPKDWNEFVEDVRKLTVIDANNQILQSGAAMGTAKNINRSTDVLNLLMLQNKTEMFDRQGRRATFDQVVKSGEISALPGENALGFYTQFAKSGIPVYAWNPNLHYSIDAFSEGTVAMMFNYSWHIPTIESKSPKLNFGIAAVPQSNAPAVNYPNYWSYSVAKNKKVASTVPNQQAVTDEIRIGESWAFIKYLTTNPEGNINVANNVVATKQVIDPNYDPAWDYLQRTKKPAARRDLIERQKTDPKLGVFAESNLVAKDWYQTKPEDIEQIFAEMIDSVNRGASTPAEAIKAAATRVTQLVN